MLDLSKKTIYFQVIIKSNLFRTRLLSFRWCPLQPSLTAWRCLLHVTVCSRRNVKLNLVSSQLSVLSCFLSNLASENVTTPYSELFFIGLGRLRMSQLPVLSCFFIGPDRPRMSQLSVLSCFWSDSVVIPKCHNSLFWVVFDQTHRRRKQNKNSIPKMQFYWRNRNNCHIFFGNMLKSIIFRWNHICNDIMCKILPHKCETLWSLSIYKIGVSSILFTWKLIMIYFTKKI